MFDDVGKFIKYSFEWKWMIYIYIYIFFYNSTTKHMSSMASYTDTTKKQLTNCYKIDICVSINQSIYI